MANLHLAVKVETNRRMGKLGNYDSIAAWAAANRAIGTRNGLHET